MKLTSCLCCIFLILSLKGRAQSKNGIDILLNRYQVYLLSSDNSFDLTARVPPINEDGKWRDINYDDQNRGGWQPARHLQRTRDLALYWSYPLSPQYHSTVLKNTILRALDHWLANRYKSSNWWYNQIGVPQFMRDIIILMRDSLSPVRLKGCLEVMAQYKISGTGANLIWSADLGLHYGALTGDTALMKQCRDTILSVITITTEEGVQPDYSFHQHGKRLQMYHYGGAFLMDDTRLAWELRGLSLAFPPEKIKILTDFVLKGWQWMARGINTVPGTIDRAASRVNGLHSADIRKLIPLFYDLLPDSTAAFRKLYSVQQGKASLIGYRYFPYSDFTAFQRPSFSFFLKTNSNRTLLTESINGENLKGDMLNSGDGYFITDGNEYFNLMPAWDWEKLPGITNFESDGGDKKDKVERMDFTGNASDGSSGLAVMEYSLQQNEQSLKARKFWASHKNITVALIADMKISGLRHPAFTVFDQCRWRGAVTINSPGNILQEGQHSFSNVRWVHHKNFVYIPLANDSIVIRLENTNGRWSSINTSEPDSAIADKIFLSSIIHQPNDTASGYIVAYAPSPKKAARIAKKPSWHILQNNAACQAVCFKDNTTMAAFYGREKIKLSETLTVAVSRPCLMLVKDDKSFFSDPAHLGGILNAAINDHHFSVELPANGTTIMVKLSSQH